MMRSLRVRIAVLLCVAIVSVVTMVTGLVLALLSPPRPEHAIEPLARQIDMLVAAATRHPESFALLDRPAAGVEDAEATAWLREVLAGNGRPDGPEVSLTRGPGKGPMTASARIGDHGWLAMPLPDLPPRKSPLLLLFGWLGLITAGAMIIAVYVAQRMVTTLRLLQGSVERIGPDGTLPPLPETGPVEVSAAARAINTLSARLKAAMDSRMRVVAAAGHDLRTPITRMRLRTEFIEDEEDRDNWLRDIDELSHIADSAIALVRASTSAAPQEALRLDELLGSIVADLRAQGHAIALRDTVAAEVRADRLALSRALRNLLINGATHGLAVEVRMQAGADGKARIVMTDRGPGIPPDRIGQAFEPFFRVDPARRQAIPGAGLGLTIARDIVQLSGGGITLRNGDGGGLIQTVELPLA